MAIKRLADMKPGEAGIVRRLHGSGNVMHRLIDMGIVPGTQVRVVKFAPLGDPVEIKVKNFSLSLRVSEAETIEAETEGDR